MRYLVAVQLPTGTEIFEFTTPEGQDVFVKSILRYDPNIDYTTSEVEDDTKQAR